MLDKIVPDKTKKMELEHAIKTQMFELSKQQNEINLAQAKHASVFVAGARPAIMWVACLGLLWSFFLAPIMNWVVVISGSFNSATCAKYRRLNDTYFIFAWAWWS